MAQQLSNRHLCIICLGSGPWDHLSNHHRSIPHCHIPVLDPHWHMSSISHWTLFLLESLSCNILYSSCQHVVQLTSPDPRTVFVIIFQPYVPLILQWCMCYFDETKRKKDAMAQRKEGKKRGKGQGAHPSLSFCPVGVFQRIAKAEIFPHRSSRLSCPEKLKWRATLCFFFSSSP